MTQRDANDSELGPDTVDDSGETRGGLEPEQFQRELVVVTATVLILGIVGGSCLGMKIKRAEQRQQQANHQADETPADQSADRPVRESRPSGR